jgi:transcription elongation factor GreA
MSKKNDNSKKATKKEDIDILSEDDLDPDEEINIEDEDLDEEDEGLDDEDGDKKKDAKEVDISEVEDVITEDEDTAAVTSPSPTIDDEDEEDKSFVKEPEDENEVTDDEDEFIEKTKTVEFESGKIQVSEEERNKVVDRLNWLRSEGRKDIAEKLKVARDFGDLSENAEYEAAKKEQAFIEGEISDLQQRLELMEVVNYHEIKDDEVHVGNIVEIERESDKQVAKYFIVGSFYESDMFCEPKKVSTDSPVGGALIGGEIGRRIHVRLPHGRTEVLKILNISH